MADHKPQMIRRFASAFILVSLVTTWASGQTATDVFPTVVFLQGNKGVHVQKNQLDGKEVEIWIKEPGPTPPRPLKMESSGTGFIVIHDDRLFLVTAEHVAAEVPFDTTVTLRGLGDKPLTFRLTDLIGNKKSTWVAHKEADVAVLPLSPPKTFEGAIKAVGLDQLSSDDQAPGLDLFLTTVGFPLSLGVHEKFSPIVKVSHPASGFFRHRRSDKQTEAAFFILDDPSVAGFSGAPVFRPPQVGLGVMSVGQGPFQCVGLVHGTFSDKTGGKFAAIVPAKFVAETVKKAAGL